MNNCAKPEILEDYPDDLMPLAEMRMCDKCGGETRWASPRQKTKGRHWSCIPGNTFWSATDNHYVRVILDIIAAFPGSTIIPDIEVRSMDVGYVGPGEGPCALCGGAIRRYGEGGLPLCKKCNINNGGTA